MAGTLISNVTPSIGPLEGASAGDGDGVAGATTVAKLPDCIGGLTFWAVTVAESEPPMNIGAKDVKRIAAPTTNAMEPAASRNPASRRLSTPLARRESTRPAARRWSAITQRGGASRRPP